MRKNGKYRFSLQFPAETEEQIQAGELLERLGNRKSAIVVAALRDYLVAHPALLRPECKVEIKAVQNLSPEQLKEMVQKMLDERLETVDCRDAKEGTTIQFNDTVIEMLDNLNDFR